MFADNLKNVRKMKGLTQADVGKKMNYSQQTIAKWEKMQSIPDVKTVAELAKKLDVPVESLLFEANEVLRSSFQTNSVEYAMHQLLLTINSEAELGYDFETLGMNEQETLVQVAAIFMRYYGEQLTRSTHSGINK